MVSEFYSKTRDLEDVIADMAPGTHEVQHHGHNVVVTKPYLLSPTFRTDLPHSPTGSSGSSGFFSLRNSDFDIPTFNTINYGKHSLRYQGPYIWSKLCNKLKDSLDIESFKKNIRKIDLTSLLNNNDN